MVFIWVTSRGDGVTSRGDWVTSRGDGVTGRGNGVISRGDGVKPAARLRRALAPRLASLASGLLGGPSNMLGLTKVGALMKKGGLRWSLRSLRFATVGYAHSRFGRGAALQGLRSLASPAPINDRPRTRC